MMRERVAVGQVILTTHSPELIDFVAAEEVRLVHFEDGHSVVSPLAQHTKQVVHDELFTLGELHRAGGLRAENEKLSTSP
jgi:predicted ATP-binding protein involved in virulence